MKNKAAVVLGMHRSGTSALARALSFYGFALPADLMKPQPDNPKGFWESLSVVRLNEEILGSLGSSWREPAPFHIPGRTLAETKWAVGEAVKEKWLPRATEVLRTSFGGAPSIVVKDPRVGLFLPLWRAAIAEAGYEPRFILIHRNPLDVAASLRARNAIAPRLGLELWQRYTLAALDPANGTGIDAVVDYEDLLGFPFKAMERLAGILGAPAPKKAEAKAGLGGFIAAEDRHHAAGSEALESSPIVAGQVKETWSLLRQWDRTAAKTRARKIGQLCRTFEEAMLMCGPLKPAKMPEAAKPEQMAPAHPAIHKKKEQPMDDCQKDRIPSTRPPLILHYHLFKNAGTSVDEMLKRNFGADWEEQEFKPRGAYGNAGEVEAWLKARPGLRALSSHTATLPAPKLDVREAFPLFFVRHPIARLKSAYDFERKQDADTFGARLAKERDFAGYLHELLDNAAHRQARNFQTSRLAFGRPPQEGSEFSRATATLAALPFCGLVEAYEESLERLQKVLASVVPGFQAVAVRKNVTEKGEHSLDEKLDRIAKEIGPDLNRALWDANADDIKLFESVRQQYDRAGTAS